MTETAAMLPRYEINYIGLDPLGAGAVITLIETASGMIRTDEEYWTRPEKISELLTELENAVEILKRRCDYICERELAC